MSTETFIKREYDFITARVYWPPGDEPLSNVTAWIPIAGDGGSILIEGWGG